MCDAFNTKLLITQLISKDIRLRFLNEFITQSNDIDIIIHEFLVQAYHKNNNLK